MNQYEAFFGYTPNLDKTQEFVASLPKATFNEAAPWAMTAEKRDTFLWLPLLQVKPTWKRGAQRIGDCVSWGAELCATMLMAINAAAGEAEWLGEAATEAIYGGGRVEADGGGLGGWSDGSYGGAAAKWLRKWGVLLRKDYSKQTGNPEHDLTTYDGNKAKNWGNYGCGGKKDERGQGLLDKVAAEHPIKSTALIRTTDELAAALMAGCPVSVASGVGYGSMARNSEGIVRRSGSWSHQMMFGGVKWRSDGTPLFRQFQSWGKSCSGADPGIEHQAISWCSWWTVPEDAQRQLNGEDSFAFSNMTNFAPPPINWLEKIRWYG